MNIVLLPGLDGTGLLFEPLCQSFSTDAQTVIFDYPPDRETTYDDLAEHILPQLPKHEPYILLGESYGGPLSLKLAENNPAGLRGLILSASFVTCPHGYIPAWSANLIVPAMFYPAPSLAKLKSLVGRYSTPEIRALISRSLTTVAPAVVASRVKEVINIDVTRELVACPVPIMYIQAMHDYVVPSGNLERIKELRPDVEVAQIEAPHMILQTQPLLAAEIIEKFANAQEKI